jgi:hypothetical protein
MKHNHLIIVYIPVLIPNNIYLLSFCFFFQDYEAVVKLSDGFNGADLRNVCTEAGNVSKAMLHAAVFTATHMRTVMLRPDSTGAFSRRNAKYFACFF